MMYIMAEMYSAITEHNTCMHRSPEKVKSARRTYHFSLQRVHERLDSWSSLEMSEDVIKEGVLLFFDTVILSLGGWIFWLIVSPLRTSAEAGYTTAVTKLITLITGFPDLILDCSLPKESLRAL